MFPVLCKVLSMPLLNFPSVCVKQPRQCFLHSTSLESGIAQLSNRCKRLPWLLWSEEISWYIDWSSILYMHACIYMHLLYLLCPACNLHVFIDCAVILPNENPALTNVMDSIQCLFSKKMSTYRKPYMEVIPATCTEESDSLLKSQGLLCPCMHWYACIYNTLINSIFAGVQDFAREFPSVAVSISSCEENKSACDSVQKQI